MKLIRNILYVSIGLFASLTMVADYLGIMDVYNVAKLTTSLLILSVPFVCHHRSMSAYSRYVTGGLGFMTVFDILILNPENLYTALLILSIANLLLARAFVSFKGYTYNTINLIILLISAVGFCSYIYMLHNSLSPILVLYTLSIIFMSWQGLNLYIQNKTEGTQLIFVSIVAYILSNLIYGVYEYVSPQFTYGLASLILYWFFAVLMVHSTTLSLKEFR